MRFKGSAAAFAAAAVMLLTFPLTALAATTAAADAANTTSSPESSSASGSSADADKSLIIMEKDGQGSILEQPDSMMFWEYPTLPAGQRREGTLQVSNQCGKEVAVSLDRIDLPYTDTDALTYLASLHITVSDADGNTLYDGPYSGIGGTGGLAIRDVSLQPNESRQYRIVMQCAFAYTGNPDQVTSRIVWNFSASSTTLTTQRASGAVKVLAAVIAVLLVVGILLALISRTRRRSGGSHGRP